MPWAGPEIVTLIKAEGAEGFKYTHVRIVVPKQLTKRTTSLQM